MATEPQQPDYELLERQLGALADAETNALANTANFVGLLFDALTDINWLGVYVLRDDELVLGPFQGKPACVRIPLGQGVCGVAAANREALLVDDVHEFDGHIVCDPASRSELVVPLIAGADLVGVMDIDSPRRERFTARDLNGVAGLCRRFEQIIANCKSTGSGFI